MKEVKECMYMNGDGICQNRILCNYPLCIKPTNIMNKEKEEMVMHKILIVDYLETRIDDLHTGASKDHDFWHGSHLEGVAKELEELKEMINKDEFSEPEKQTLIPLSELGQFHNYCINNGHEYAGGDDWDLWMGAEFIKTVSTSELYTLFLSHKNSKQE